MFSVLLTISVLAILAGWALHAYRSLVGQRQRVLEAWREVDADLKRRHDLVATLVDALRGLPTEPGLLEAVASARDRAAAARGPEVASQREYDLDAALARLVTVVDGDEVVRSSPPVAAARSELTGADQRLAAASRVYNERATRYNASRASVFTGVVAGLAGFKRAELMEARH